MFGWFRKPIPATPPLIDYMVTVHVRLAKAMVGRGDVKIAGYYRVLGLRTTPGALSALIESCVTDGTIIWDDTETRIIDVVQADRRITKPLRSTFGAGVWHESGRVFYPEEPGAPEPANDPVRGRSH